MTRQMTEAEYREHQLKYGRAMASKEVALGFARAEPASVPAPVKRLGKHRNEPVLVDGIKFHSKREAGRWAELKMLEASGKISELVRQQAYVLAEAVVLDGRKKPALRYFSDFEYVQDGKVIVEDCKSPHLRKDAVFRIKCHLMMSIFGIDILLT